MLVPKAVQIPGGLPIHSEFGGVKTGQLLFPILEPSSWAVHFDSDFWVRHKMMYLGYQPLQPNLFLDHYSFPETKLSEYHIVQ